MPKIITTVVQNCEDCPERDTYDQYSWFCRIQNDGVIPKDDLDRDYDIHPDCPLPDAPDK